MDNMKLTYIFIILFLLLSVGLVMASDGSYDWVRSIFQNVVFFSPDRTDVNISYNNGSLEYNADSHIFKGSVYVDRFCFEDGYCMVKQSGVLYEDISGVNNSMPLNGTFYEVMFS